MNPKRLITALLLALGISGLFTFWLSQRFSKVHAAVQIKHQYVAAASSLEAGDLLRPTSLKMVDWPEISPLVGAFVKPEDLNGRTVLYPLAEGQPILERQLSAPGAGSGITVKIPEGMRAISLRSNEVVGVAGFLLPGTYVDVLVTYHEGAMGEPVTSTILQDVQVLAAGQKIQPDPEGKASTVDVVTLLVTPGDAERAVLASSQGIVHFVLRNGTDREKVKSTSIELSGLGGDSAPRAVQPRRTTKNTQPAATAGPYVVETMAGSKGTLETFK
jgi:pilus assembly protein CpaB